MELLALVAYGFYLALIVLGGVAAVRCRSLVRALLGLILTLFGVAGMYFLMAAPFMALMQILIYVGAVTVLIFFAIMLTRPPGGEAGEEGNRPRIGQAFIAIDPSALAGTATYLERVETVVRTMLSDAEVRLPGARRFAAEKSARAQGVEVPDELLAQIEKLCST